MPNVMRRTRVFIPVRMGRTKSYEKHTHTYTTLCHYFRCVNNRNSMNHEYRFYVVAMHVSYGVWPYGRRFNTQ